jgi:hypothetical protein
MYAFGRGWPISEAAIVGGIVGSMNLTGAGLTSNVESYAQFFVSRDADPERLKGFEHVEQLLDDSAVVNDKLMIRYRAMRRQRPDIGAPEKVPGQYRPNTDLDEAHLRALRSARYMWTDTLKIVENLGDDEPGNQVDLKKGTRVFFGSNTPLSAPINTPLGSVMVSAGGVPERCMVRFGNNAMDKITLPLPGGSNPKRYDHCCLLWERAGDEYILRVDKTGQAWKAASDRERTRFRYSRGGREWGFFSKPL